MKAVPVEEVGKRLGVKGSRAASAAPSKRLCETRQLLPIPLASDSCAFVYKPLRGIDRIFTVGKSGIKRDSQGACDFHGRDRTVFERS